MKQIPLTRGQFALVDDEDYPMLVAMGKWFYSAGYAVRSYSYKNTNDKWSCKQVKMHRLVTNAPKGKSVDHIDGNPLNNQKSNLRICTNAENLRNRGFNKNNTSGYKGVFWHKPRSKWTSKIKVNRASIYLGLFSCRHEAARAYNAAALEHFGEFAFLNPIP